jgi:hypothetical protein
MLTLPLPASHTSRVSLDPGHDHAKTGAASRSESVSNSRQMSEGQRAYEARRAEKAGMSLDKWLAAKEKDRLAEEKARTKAVEAARPPKPPGFFGRLIDRLHKPLGT